MRFMYRGWLITEGPAHPVTGRYRAERYGVGMGHSELDGLRRMVDQKVDEAEAKCEARKAAQHDASTYFSDVVSARGATSDAVCALERKVNIARRYMTSIEFEEYRATMAESGIQLAPVEQSRDVYAEMKAGGALNDGA